jgi:hypothetical protein
MAASYKKAMIQVSGPDLFELRQAFKQLPTNIAARVIGAGLRRAAKPGEVALKRITPKGPTGNLFRSIKTIVKKYPRDGAAVAVVGYVKAGTGKSKSAGGGKVKKGPDRAFHQFWIEFGTSDRIVSTPATSSYKRSSRSEKAKLVKALGKKQAKELITKTEIIDRQGGYIASSFNKLGPFVLKKSKGGGRVQTSPGYPKAFFKKSATPIHIAGVGSQHPVETAFRMSKNAIAANLTGEMRKALENGLKILEDQARRAAQMNDLAKHL